MVEIITCGASQTRPPAHHHHLPAFAREQSVTYESC
jgi:hypothetical protein